MTQHSSTTVTQHPCTNLTVKGVICDIVCCVCQAIGACDLKMCMFLTNECTSEYIIVHTQIKCYTQTCKNDTHTNPVSLFCLYKIDFQYILQV